MDRKILIGLLMIQVFLISCLNMNDPKSQVNFISCRDSYDSTLVRFIPKKIPNNMISDEFSSLANLSDYGDYTGINLTTKINNHKKYLEIKEQYIKQTQYIRNSQDTCLLVIRTYGELHEDDNNANKCDKLLPVPQYAIYETNDSIKDWRRAKDEQIIILDFGSGDFAKRKKLKQRKDLPVKWSNGYSTGITANDKKQTIMYWLIVW
jgi:hypothetical protein